jgi:hypothetical protein
MMGGARGSTSRVSELGKRDRGSDLMFWRLASTISCDSRGRR